MIELNGIGASDGIAIAKAYSLKEPEFIIENKTVSDKQQELKKLDDALNQAKSELEQIRDTARVRLGEEKAAIFSAHLLVLQDPEFIEPVKADIENNSICAEYALKEKADMFIAMFEAMDNEYMKERAADIKDVSKRVISHLLSVPLPNLSLISEEVIVVAEDLTPSDTAQLNGQYVKGFTTNIGGRTSHSAIMARSMEIPAVVGTKQATSEIQNGMILIVDGFTGKLIIDPTEKQLIEYKQKHEQYVLQREEWSKLVNEATVTEDGHHVELAANIGKPEDVEKVLENGAEGIGLYRTEFLYMERDKLPTEEEQFDAYKTVLEKMEGKPVVVRTLDIGGDKELPYLKLPHELNPFLGFRAIRLCLEQQDIFRTQLRALLRASTFGNLKIMFPMIATVDEFNEAKSILMEEKQKLIQENIEVAEDIEIGMMVEIPSAAVLADQFAKVVDFFSIGTNDLIQYTMAADRMNERVSYLYQPYNPAILRLVSMVIDAAHQQGRWVGMCGEMAGDKVAIPLLLGLGLDEFSMSASSILPARTQLKHLSKAHAASHKAELLAMDTAEKVIDFAKETYAVN
ncbi:phosphoenolpyruvate--protein phosphotransferase [Longirhabdus pacifica]|uniref:phosphoenolpyruvate--protein phosphotransferase n=1 Tax=Longirhabdus pacifica TaxID=2305227 RepID=UPI001008DCC6|nr:phosphoenolpyruvate--protein phosphotransferase [Longirhabdus pacifica]